VEGDLYAGARVEIHASGKFCGNLLTPSLIIHEGGVLEGYCKMEKISQEADHNLISHKEDPPLSA
jgi:cytoskeletal protein CcmA (bactofilin family)